jgi:hypothetical protein
MLRFAGAAMMAGLFLFGSPASVERAAAEVVVAINKATQRMTVVVDGGERHVWKISTGLGGGPPSGNYRPERLERKWFSHKYGWAPMPHSIFFHEGYAIHGTIHVSRLGRRASHGCVRLHPSNAAILFDLVRRRGMSATTILVSNSDIVARRRPAPKVEAAAPLRRVPAVRPERDPEVRATRALRVSPTSVEQ